MSGRPVTIALCGDVMTGRGVDQILPHPGDARLREDHVDDARTYVELAEAVSGPIPRRSGYAWPWGDALEVLAGIAPHLRVANLETSVTDSDDAAADKALHYRMNPQNVPCLAAAGTDVCSLANNHVLDFGRQGLLDTLDALARAGIVAVGAGRSGEEAERPAALAVAGGGRVVLLAVGAASSGIPPHWAAGADRAGVALLPDLSDGTAAAVCDRAARVRRPGDAVVVSVHWGSNWGYDVPGEHVRFAHALVDGGADVVFGHSSHHPRPIEVYRGRLVLYGCGDFIDDYEGIGGYQEYRNELRLLYAVSVEPGTGALAGLRMAPLRSRRMRLERAAPDDARWLGEVLDRISTPFGSRVAAGGGGMLVLRTDHAGSG